MSNYWLYHGDCVEVMKTWPENSVDAVVCDPPAGIAMMAKEWDDFRRSRNPSDVGRDNAFGRLSARAPEVGRGSMENFIGFICAMMAGCLRVLKPGGHALVWAIPRTSHWTAMGVQLAGFDIRDVVHHIFATGMPKGGRRGTNMAPAAEHWILARKPCKGSITAAHARYGTGLLGIDACRIPREDGDRTEYGVDGDEGSGSANVYSFRPQDRGAYEVHPLGRWPANVITDGGEEWSKYFYCPKPSRRERDFGCEHLPKKTGGEATDRKDGSAGLNSPCAGAGRTGGKGGVHNFHPT